MNTATAKSIWRNLMWEFENRYPEVYKALNARDSDALWNMEEHLISVIKQVAND